MNTYEHFSFIKDDFRFEHVTTTNFSGTISLHSHDMCELLFLKKGSMTYLVGGKSFQLTPNCLVFSHPLETHALVADASTTYERYIIQFDPNMLTSGIYHKISSDVSVINFDGKELVCSLFDKMDYYCKQEEHEVLKDLLLHLIEEVLYHVMRTSRVTAVTSPDTIHPVLTEAIRYIYDNLTAPISLESICSALFITKSHLHHLFDVHLHTTPKKYITILKLHLAQKELQSGLSPTEVCTRCGFGNYATFFRNYRQHFGVPPSQSSSVKPFTYNYVDNVVR